MIYGENIYIPNAFSPNNDLENDLFQVYFVNPKCVKDFKMVIYNRWGEEIIETTDAAHQWDGTYQGTAMNPAVLTYYIYVQFKSGNEVIQKGNVSLVR
jgi:gliding motility-associated-like protein